MPSTANVTFINDEVSSSLEEAMQFARENHISTIEMRTVNGVNLMNLSLDEVQRIASSIYSNGLEVTCFASPLLKWLPKHKQGISSEVNWHGYTPQSANLAEVFTKAFAIADLLQAKYIRIFSYLKYQEFRDSDLDEDLKELLKLAEQHNKVLLLENEPVCNIITLSSQFDLLSRWEHPRLRALIDIGNLYQANQAVIGSDIAKLAPYIEYAHIKDFSNANSEYVILGNGSIAYQNHIRDLIDALQNRNISFSLETHVQPHSSEATRLSLLYLRKMLASL